MAKPLTPLKGGIEYDVFTGWRRLLCYTSRPGVCKWAKNHYWRRVRRKQREDLKRRDQ
jgi:hypothetical protein